jgi:endonuclease YncB( thermonuclease family)
MFSIILIVVSIFIANIALGKEYVVNKIISGDTIQLDTGEKVKYIGIEAPELNMKEGGPEFFARQASRQNQKLVLLKKVRLEFDKEKKDSKGRTLAYVFVKNVFVNAELIKLGYAKTNIVPPNDKYKNMFLDYEKKAKQSEKGLWQEVKKDTETSYIGNKRSYVFHRPSCKFIDKIPEKSKIVFRNRADAIKIGYIPDKACKP